MNLGLGNRIELKRQLLTAAIVSETTYDTLIDAIGKGVAGLFDQFCARKFERGVGVTEEFDGEREHWRVERFPIESVSAVDIRDDMATGWVSQTVNDVIIQRNDKSGLLKFGTRLGTSISHVRVTYTGGYWFDESETETGSLPAGATQVPSDLKWAWFTQCKEVWNKRDALGLNLIEEARPGLNDLALVPLVVSVLNKYMAHGR